MATKKYLSYEGLSEYDALIKAEMIESEISVKEYADNAANAVKNDLLNGAGAAYDTLKELGQLIDENHDAIDALEIIAINKADKDHNHDSVYETKENAQLKYDTITDAKADWNQNDESGIDYVKNRTHWVEDGSITYDFSTYECISEVEVELQPEEDEYYHSWWAALYDTKPVEYDKIIGSQITIRNSTNSDGIVEELITITSDDIIDNKIDNNIVIINANYNGVAYDRVLIVYDNTIYNGVELNTGIWYIVHHVSYAQYSRSDAFTARNLIVPAQTYHTLDEKFIPDTIARMSDVQVAVDMAADAKFYVVTFDKGTDNKYHSDLTFSEIREKFEAGGNMVARIDGTDYIPLLSAASHQIIFSGIYQGQSVALTINSSDVCALTTTHLALSSHGHSNASETDNGFMSSDDKIKLDSIDLSKLETKEDAQLKYDELKDACAQKSIIQLITWEAGD